LKNRNVPTTRLLIQLILSPTLLQNSAPNEVEEEIKRLKENTGFSAYMIVNNDGKAFFIVQSKFQS
jgi:hypothetical protein